MSGYRPVIFLLLSLAFLPSLAAVEVFCVDSSLLPAGIHLVETTECFSVTVAEDLSVDATALGRYLDRFDGDAPSVSAAYRYWYYLRTEQFLPALLTLIDLVNGARSSEPAQLFRDELSFLVMSGIRRLPADVDLFSRDNDLTRVDLSHRFFFILDQVATLYADGGNDLRRDAWLLYRSFTLFFSSVGSFSAVDDDPFLYSVLGRYRRLWKEGSLLSYLDFFTFFTGGTGDYLPPVSLYVDKFTSLVPLPKSRAAHTAATARRTLTRLMARFNLENIGRAPRIHFIDTDDIHAWYRHFRAQSDPYRERCEVFDTRNEMLSTFRGDLFRPFMENRALALMEGCDPAHRPPFVIEGDAVYLPSKERWLVDVAMIEHMILYGPFSYREAAALMTSALYAALARYGQREEKTPFGEALIYAQNTGRLAPFRDALFLYRRYREEPELTGDNLSLSLRFVAAFFYGGIARGEHEKQ